MSLSPQVRRVLWWLLCLNLALIFFAILLGLYRRGNPTRHFNEGRFTTVVSCVQLLAVSVLSFKIFTLRRQAPAAGRTKTGFAYAIWLLIAIGFVYLACDEAFQFHEKLGITVRRALDLPKGPLSKRFNDVLIGLYGLIGLGTLWICRREILAFRQQMFRLLLIGFATMFVAVIFDMLSSDKSFFYLFTSDKPTARFLSGACYLGDGAFTLISEAIFVAAFYAGWEKAKIASAGADD
jgi:hypothetical protein